MRTIHKYQIHAHPGDPVVISMPSIAKVLTVQMQHGIITLWAEVVTSAASYVDRKFIVYGTGWAMTEYPWNGGRIQDKYIGTVQNGALVWHVYEVL